MIIGADPEIMRKTFADLRARGICTPLGKSPIPDIFRKVMIRPDGTDPMDDHPEWTGRQKDARKKRKPSMPRAKSAFLRALDNFGWSLKDAEGFLCDPIDAVEATFGKFRVSFYMLDWELLEGESTVHRQEYKAGSMAQVRRWVP